MEQEVTSAFEALFVGEVYTKLDFVLYQITLKS